MIVIGLLAAIAILKYIDLRHRALAAAAVGDLEAVRARGLQRLVRDRDLAGRGRRRAWCPPGLVPYLPQNFSFSRPEYTLDWESFVPPGGGTAAGMQVGVVITSTDPRMQLALQQTLGNKLPFIAVNGTLTFVIVGPDGRS